MTRDKVLTALRLAIIDECGAAPDRLDPAMTASDIQGWDSLAHVRIMMNLEARLDTEIDIDRSYRMADFDRLATLVADGTA